MQLAIDAVADRRAQGAVSAGNTGALMALGVLRMGVMPEIKRPAICAPMPTRESVSWILDLGANVDCDAQQLHQFAQMGNALVKVLSADSSYFSSSFWRKPESHRTAEKDSGFRQNDEAGVNAPRIALLNIGSEAGKGNALVQEAAQLINDDIALNFVGFVEGNTLYDGAADVIVCDGFAGNVLLKTAEGVAGFIRERLKLLAKQSLFTRLLAVLAMPLLKRLSAEMNADQYNGACLLGLKGVVVKSHGNASADAFAQAIACAYAAAKQDLSEKLMRALSGAS
jgi:glycerol-3-phosphate acyltransferase PlsX